MLTKSKVCANSCFCSHSFKKILRECIIRNILFGLIFNVFFSRMFLLLYFAVQIRSIASTIRYDFSLVLLWSLSCWLFLSFLYFGDFFSCNLVNYIQIISHILFFKFLLMSHWKSLYFQIYFDLSGFSSRKGICLLIWPHLY